MTTQRAGIVVAAALLLLSGCLPYSCRREESTALMPSDSVSREMAAAVATDTLRLVWTHSVAGDRALLHPRTVRFGAAGRDEIYVSDVEAGAVFVFDTVGSLRHVIETVEVPYLAGIRGDTIAVFAPSGPSIHLLVDGKPVDTLAISDPERPRTSLVYGAFGPSAYYKRVDDAETFVAEVRRDGTLGARVSLPGPHWRHAGMLRFWDDIVVSLSGFRPVVDLVRPGKGVDTLALRGFDSPMLARSRSFLTADVDEPPLLSSSAAASGDLLFVVNLRAGWLQIDAFDRSGRLVHRLTERGRSYRRAFFPQDLDVRRGTGGSYIIAVVFSAPEPAVSLYAWDPQ